LKTLITRIQDDRGTYYETWAELLTCVNPHGTSCLRFSSIWTGAKKTQEPQIKAEFFLDAQGRAELRDLLDRLETQ
jgi:hypothetical protein